MKHITTFLLPICLFSGLYSWKELTYQEIRKSYGDLAYKAGLSIGIKQVLIDAPEIIESTRPLLLLVVHGTYAGKSFETDVPYMTRVQACGQQLALMRKAPIRIIYFGWSGLNTDKARIDAGELLAKVIDAHEGFEVITIAHSHGGTAINYASNKIKHPIDLMVHYAVPVMPQEEYKPSNFKLLCNFYSLTDIVQLIGSHALGKALKSLKYHTAEALAAAREFTQERVGENSGRIVNIRTRFHGYEADHTGIKNAIAVLPQVIDDLSEQYRLHNQLELNVDITQKDNAFLLMARSELLENNQAMTEIELSKKQKEIFKKLYGKEISGFNLGFSYFSHVLSNTLLLIPLVRDICRDYKLTRYVPRLSHINF